MKENRTALKHKKEKKKKDRDRRGLCTIQWAVKVLQGVSGDGAKMVGRNCWKNQHMYGWGGEIGISVSQALEGTYGGWNKRGKAHQPEKGETNYHKRDIKVGRNKRRMGYFFRVLDQKTDFGGEEDHKKIRRGGGGNRSSSIENRGMMGCIEGERI